jgi:hypothetical protein
MGAITPKQQSFIKSLLVERALTLGLNSETDVDAYITEHKINELTSKSASTLIDSIRKIEVKRAGTDHLPKAERTIVNKFSNPCALCGHDVPAGAGYAVLVGGKWSTYHKAGECSSEHKAQPVNIQTLFEGVDDGFYALQSTGKNDLVFYAVSTNKGIYDASKKGLRGIYLVVGGHKDKKLNGEQAVNAIKRIVGLSPQERIDAQALYGREIGRCGVCGRHLTDEVTRKRGIGNDCASKLGI